MLDLVQAGGDERHPQPAVAALEPGQDEAQHQPDRAVPEEVDRLEVKLPEHAVGLREAAVVQQQLRDLNRVLAHVADL